MLVVVSMLNRMIRSNHDTVQTKQKEGSVRALHCANRTEGSVRVMSPLNHDIICNKRVRSRLLIMCQLIENSSIEGSVRS